MTGSGTEGTTASLSSDVSNTVFATAVDAFGDHCRVYAVDALPDCAPGGATRGTGHEDESGGGTEGGAADGEDGIGGAWATRSDAAECGAWTWLSKN